MTSQPGKQTIAILILPNISRNKGNQTMKFGQLVEYNMRNSLRTKWLRVRIPLQSPVFLIKPFSLHDQTVKTKI